MGGALDWHPAKSRGYCERLVMPREFAPTKVSPGAAPSEELRTYVRRSGAIETESSFEGWHLPAWTTSPTAQITIAACRAIGQLAQYIEGAGVDTAALARLKSIQVAVLEILRRGFADLDRNALTAMYRLVMMTQRTLREIPRQERPKGWDTRLFTVHADFARLVEVLHLEQKEKPAKSSESRIEAIARKSMDLAKDLKSLEPQQRDELRLLINETLAQAFESTNSTPVHDTTRTEQQAAPSQAPELWARREEFKGQTALGFLQRVYGFWLDRMRLADIAALDHPLYQALQTWRRRNTPPPHLASFFARKRRSRADIDAELKKHKIKKPDDAFARFPDDRATAQRLYQAARSRQTR